MEALVITVIVALGLAVGYTISRRPIITELKIDPNAGQWQMRTGGCLHEAQLEILRAAVLDEGPSPEFHRTALRNLRRSWPTLYYAVRAFVGPEMDRIADRP